MVLAVRVELPGPIVREPEVAKIPNFTLKHTLVGSTSTASLEMIWMGEARFGQNLDQKLWNDSYVPNNLKILIFQLFIEIRNRKTKNLASKVKSKIFFPIFPFLVTPKYNIKSMGRISIRTFIFYDTP